MLLEAVAGLPFEPFRIEPLVDARRRDQLDLDPGSPLTVQLLSFPTSFNPLRFNWHERLELLVPVAGRGRFRMGDRVFDFARGDVVVVDNLKLRGLADCHGPRRPGGGDRLSAGTGVRHGSCLCDSLCLPPFNSRRREIAPVLRGTDELPAEAHAALGKLAKRYLADQTPGQGSRAGGKAQLPEALYLRSAETPYRIESVTWHPSL